MAGKMLKPRRRERELCENEEVIRPSTLQAVRSMEKEKGSSSPSEGPQSKRPRVVDLSLSSDDEGESEVQAAGKGKATAADGGGKMPAALPLLPFYVGTVRGLNQTYNEQCLSIQDVFSGEFHKALLMNFMVDLSWLCRSAPRLESVPWLCVYDEKGGLVGERLPNIDLFVPNLKGSGFLFGSHHSKMAILWYRHGVRVMVATGNYISIDWENKTEGIFVQDFPFIATGTANDNSAFGKDLRDYLTKLNSFQSNLTGLDGRRGHPKLDEAIDELRRVDFSAAQGVLIPSVPGKHTGQDLVRYGHMKVRKMLEQEPSDAAFHPSVSGESSCGVVTQFSSMGSHAKDGKWVKEEFEASLKAGSTSQEAAKLRTYLVWPRMVDVRNSNEGWRGGGALPCRPPNMFDNSLISPILSSNTIKPFIRERLSLFQAEGWSRHHAMPHLKSFTRFAHVTTPTSDGKKVPRLAWALIASQNYGQAAWGVFQDKGRVFKIQSFEMGVLFLPSRYRSLPQRTFSCTPDHPLLGIHNPGIDSGITTFIAVNCHAAKQQPEPGVLHIPIPYALPPQRYSFPTDEPWVSDLPSEDRDINGNRMVLGSDGRVRVQR